MFNLLGFSINLPPNFEFLIVPWVTALANAVAWVVIALFINFILVRIIRPIIRRLPGDLEDIIFAILRIPILILILVFGLSKSLTYLPLTPAFITSMQLVTTTIFVHCDNPHLRSGHQRHPGALW